MKQSQKDENNQTGIVSQENKNMIVENDKNEADMQTKQKKQPFKILQLQDIIKMERRIRQNKRITIDLSGSRYDILREVAQEFKWNIIENSNSDNCQDYMIRWYDTYIQEEQLRYLLPYQKINRFPGSFSIGRKNLLARNLMKMKKNFPNEYNFFPKTWLLPIQYEDLRQYCSKSNFSKYLIVKPENNCQGRGIFLTKRIENVLEYGEHYVIQEYLNNPLLIDELKFDLRVYVLVKSISPLKIFIYREGLARFATNKYEKPNKHNYLDLMTHLTNYAINKKSEKFQYNQNQAEDNTGHKRSLSQVLLVNSNIHKYYIMFIKKLVKKIQNDGKDAEQVYEGIKQIIIKTFFSVNPNMAHTYKSCQPKEENSEISFEIYGFDIMIDENYKPWLIEVNHTPSFSVDTPLDYHIKKCLILDTLILSNITWKARKQYYEARNTINPSQKGSTQNKLGKEEIEALRSKIKQWEQNNMGGYEQIYPEEYDTEIQEKYELFLKDAQSQYDEWSGAKINRVVKKEVKKDLPPLKQLNQKNSQYLKKYPTNFNQSQQKMNTQNQNQETEVANISVFTYQQTSEQEKLYFQHWEENQKKMSVQKRDSSEKNKENCNQSIQNNNALIVSKENIERTSLGDIENVQTTISNNKECIEELVNNYRAKRQQFIKKQSSSFTQLACNPDNNLSTQQEESFNIMRRSQQNFKNSLNISNNSPQIMEKSNNQYTNREERSSSKQFRQTYINNQDCNSNNKMYQFSNQQANQAVYNRISAAQKKNQKFQSDNGQNQLLHSENSKLKQNNERYFVQLARQYFNQTPPQVKEKSYLQLQKSVPQYKIDASLLIKEKQKMENRLQEERNFNQQMFLIHSISQQQQQSQQTLLEDIAVKRNIKYP